jgi:hypothetical protein
MATTANQPTYQPTGFLGGPTLRFSGASQRLQVAHAASLDSTEYSFFGAVIGCVSRVVEILLSRPPSGLICA